ncbi:hypothetical protein ITP53_27385 [Nonomuraea sp. K274]|uniref:Uncharacterized protein n=1 Tax=Nonomuraea cypriaca TaxID=1187855 RepID=A0A931AAT7_9ACTN|nr:hypothetical protein [Nonomuraea cypriaca]MBF8189391.1 hypothetical protein [Nonomuraea cypriaca]
MPYGSPPPGNRNAVLIGVIVALSVLLVGGGAFGAYAYVNAPGPMTTVAQPSTPPSAPPSVPPSAPPSSAPPSAAPTDTPEAEPTEPSTTPAESTEARSPLTHTEFDDWKLDLGDLNYEAVKVGGWTYDSCDPVDAEGVLADNGCERGVQLAYSAYGGSIKAAQIIVSFPSGNAAKTAASRLAKLTSDALIYRRSATHNTYTYGKVRSGAYKNYLVATVVTATKAGSSKASKFHQYLQADRGLFLLMRRDNVVTS